MIILDVLIFISYNMQLCQENSSKQTEYKKVYIDHPKSRYKAFTSPVIQILGVGGVVVSKLGSRHWHSEQNMS